MLCKGFYVNVVVKEERKDQSELSLLKNTFLIL